MKVDRDRLIARFTDIEDAVERLSKFLQITKSEFLQNPDNIHIARSHLLIATESAIAICYHLSAKLLKKSPTHYGKCFDMISGILSNELCSYLKKLVALRNKMVHRYEEIDYGFLYDNFKEIIENLKKLIQETTIIIERKSK